MKKITRMAVGVLVAGGFTLASMQSASAAGPLTIGTPANGQGLQVDLFQGWDATGQGDVTYTQPYGPDRTLFQVSLGTAAPPPSSGNLISALGNARPVNICIWCV